MAEPSYRRQLLGDKYVDEEEKQAAEAAKAAARAEAEALLPPPDKPLSDPSLTPMDRARMWVWDSKSGAVGLESLFCLPPHSYPWTAYACRCARPVRTVWGV
eukprot:358808-Chlamydomonas_euryale.AAC.5